MACFLVPAAEAVVTTVVAKTAKKEGSVPTLPLAIIPFCGKSFFSKHICMP